MKSFAIIDIIYFQGYFRPLFIEFSNKHIDVTMVCPGPVQTEFLAESFTEKSGEVRIIKIFVYKFLWNIFSFCYYIVCVIIIII